MNKENVTLEKETETFKKVEFEKITCKNIEIMVSKEISEPLTYSMALDWCKASGGRLPTIQELETLYNEKDDIKNNFEEKTFWSGTEFYGNVWGYDFKNGKKVLCRKEDVLDIANVANVDVLDTANTRAVYIIE